jgi:hypothetical protein
MSHEIGPIFIDEVPSGEVPHGKVMFFDVNNDIVRISIIFLFQAIRTQIYPNICVYKYKKAC